MVGINMDGSTRDQVLKLMDEKDRLEREIREQTLVLQTNGDVGMNEPLVDPEGFPRNDIDVYRVRHARHRILCLQNDHKEIMKLIERGLNQLHQETRGEASSHAILEPMDTSSHINGTIQNGHIQNGHMQNGHMQNGHASNGHANGHSDHVAMVVEGTRELRVSDRAFAKVNFVSPGSPAEAAGLQQDDELLEFGSINATNFTNLSQIADIVRHSVGSTLRLRVRRGDIGRREIASLTLSPATWSGRGLLGCNVVPV